MSILDSPSAALTIIIEDPLFNEAELAAAAFLARYSGRTLESYRFDLRVFFQWAEDVGLDVLAATRPHIELYRMSMEERGLAPSTIDRRLSTVCGYYKFAHIDGRVASNPAQYVRRPKVHPSEGRGSTGPARDVPVHRRAHGPGPLRPGVVVGPERAAHHRGL